MRKPERIPKILEEIEKIWAKCPNFRLGQLLMCCIIHEYRKDLFHIEDDELIKCLKGTFSEKK